MRTLNTTLLILLFTLIMVSNAVFSQERPQPNVVLLLTDDLGWQDVKCYDIDEASPYETPNIDNLATKGVLFWEAYSPAPTCSPSRAAILSGNHPARANMTHVLGGGPPVPYIRETSRMLSPYYTGRMPENEQTIARTLQQNGYKTGHTGKWHVAVGHDAYPQPIDQGFDYSKHDLGVSKTMLPDRLSDFASADAGDIYQLDEDGFPLDQTTMDALTFMDENKDTPFFLYYASYLVHAPIQTRSEELLIKYCNKLGIDVPTDPGNLTIEGQGNPYYCAMVEQLDCYVGQILDYLDNTDDPRWPGHKLSENTYIIFTSDNGGYERVGVERITDNNPLDRGKISSKEGGTRVPLIITGPGISQGLESNVMINGLDFYPTILSLLNMEKPEGKNLDGCDISTLLLNDPTDAQLVLTDSGTVRNTMVWHYPHGDLESTIRIGDYKLFRNYDHVNNSFQEEFDLYHLYQTNDSGKVRIDIEEAISLSTMLPDMTLEMNNKLSEVLEEMDASYAYYNPDYTSSLPHKDEVPTVNGYLQKEGLMEFSYTENGATLVKADLIYTLNGGEEDEEFFKTDAEISSTENKVFAQLPNGTTHVFLNLIDENNFMVSYPLPMDTKTKSSSREDYSVDAIAVEPFAVEINENLALKGIASQSSTNFEAEAYLAIDGVTNGSFGGGSVTHTLYEENPWWQVDLGSDNGIGEIKIFNRTDECCVDRLSNFTVTIFDAAGNITYSQTYTSYPNPSISIDGGGVIGQIIKVQSNQTVALNLAEGQVFDALPTLSLNSPTITDKIRIYPNPVSEIINVEYSGTETVIMNVIDLTGHIIISTTIQSGNTYFDISDLSSGFYIVRISNEDETYLTKIIKM